MFISRQWDTCLYLGGQHGSWTSTKCLEVLVSFETSDILPSETYSVFSYDGLIFLRYIKEIFGVAYGLQYQFNFASYKSLLILKLK